MGLSAFVRLTDFRGKPKQWKIPCSKNKVKKYKRQDFIEEWHIF